MDGNQSAFQRLKVTCVPLLANSLLTPSTIPVVIKLLTDLHTTLTQLQSSGHVLAPTTISYVFFPLSSILRRNDLSTIPDRVLEKLLAILALLSDIWWWDMEIAAWEQVFLLASAILGGIDRKGKGRDRDEETKVAAVDCLWALLRERSPDQDPGDPKHDERASSKFLTLQLHAQLPKFIPVMGQTLNSLMLTAESPHLPLQRVSLRVLSVIVKDYLHDSFVTSILPGTVSSMSKVALGSGASKGWANGDIVSGALLVMQYVIVHAVGDDICAREGAVRSVDHLEDLLDDPGGQEARADNASRSRFSTQRTATWLRGTASQLHIAINALSPLVKHQSPIALIGLATFSAAILSATTLTVPQSQPRLLSFLLSLKASSFDRVSAQADASLRQILTGPATSRQHILQVLLQISRDHLAALPRLLLSHADAKVEHVATVLESVCNLATPPNGSELPGVSAISTGVGKLLGPHGGVEKWGWSLLSTLEFVNPPVVVAQTSAAQLMLESDPSAVHVVPFPELTFRHVDSRSAREALERMFRALGRTAGDEALFAIEWFLDVGQSSRGQRAVAALWCACRLLEGVGQVSLDSPTSSTITASRGRRLDKFARDLARRVAETWDNLDDEEVSLDNANPKADVIEENTVVEHVQGLVTMQALPGTGATSMPSSTNHAIIQPLLHRVLSLQLLSITAGILEVRFLPLLLHVLYPVLHGIVSETSVVSASALAALNFITNSTSHATPANLLLSNFDYALDAVSRRLTRRWLDVDATKVLAVLVRLVGRDVVQKAGDVVEECFDRLDEYHGYEIIVDGLVEVLGEVVKVIEEDEENKVPKESRKTAPLPSHVEDPRWLDNFEEWFRHRHDQPPIEEITRDSSYPRESGAEKEVPEGDGDDNGASQKEHTRGGGDPFDEPPPTPTQALTTQIVSRSIYFLTHGAPTVRARILLLLARAVPVLPESALLPSVHHAWPFVLNRLADAETFVVSSAAALVAALAEHVGDFMVRRVWDDVWPRFRELLHKLDRADTSSALARRVGGTGVGTESAYTHSHRLYRAIMMTMAAAVRGVQAQDAACWEVVVLFRRFLRREAHEELQACARDLYAALCANNEDAVWLALEATLGRVSGPVAFLAEPKWDIEWNVKVILGY
ncbi:armadillo-type protein [Earliella scabrosa]|nr:armadillo-type protein [Earliella scabrosa]